MAYWVYVLKSRIDSYNYVGCTDNLKKRLSKHNSGAIFSTKNRLPFDLIYVEIFIDKRDAFSREKFLKTGWGKNFIKRTLKNYFLSKKLGG